MNGSFGPDLVGRPASSQVSGQQVQEGLGALWRLQAAGQLRPGLEAAKPALRQARWGRDMELNKMSMPRSPLGCMSVIL